MGPIIAALALLLAPSQTNACERAREQYEALSLEDALTSAEEVLERDPSRPLACLEVKALALVVLGRLDESRGAFTELFERSPDHAVVDPSLSPAQRSAIEEIRESVRPLEATVKARWLIYDSLRIDVLLTGGLRDATRVRYRLAALPKGTEQSGEVPLAGRAATATAAVAGDSEVSRVRVSGQVINDLDRVLSQFSTEILLPPRPSAPGPVVIDSGGVPWLLWAGIGLAAAGAAVAIAVLAQPKLPSASGTLGRREVD